MKITLSAVCYGIATVLFALAAIDFHTTLSLVETGLAFTAGGLLAGAEDW